MPEKTSTGDPDWKFSTICPSLSSLSLASRTSRESDAFPQPAFKVHKSLLPVLRCERSPALAPWARGLASNDEKNSQDPMVVMF